AATDELTEWAAAKVHRRKLKSAKWIVDEVDKRQVYQVNDLRNVEIVDLDSHECTCQKWQLSGLPCGHVIATSVYLKLTNCCLFAKHWFRKTTVRETYKELVYPLQGPSSWETPTDKQNVLPPTMEKQMPGRPSNNDRFRSRGESRDKTPCGTCGKKGHKSMSCKGPKKIQSKRQQKIKRNLFKTGSTSQPST
ncbi:transposase, MuDR, MULE transposase domain protein, partial [Tanacetum coccineum]